MTTETKHPTFTTVAHILGYRIEMTSDEIRRELESMKGLIFDTDDRIEWKCLNDELKRRGETSVKYRM
jgi:hypothetical protein